jgi:hypothetical protein
MTMVLPIYAILHSKNNWHTVKSHKSNKYAYNQQLSFPCPQILRINILSLFHSYVNNTQITKINTRQMHGA